MGALVPFRFGAAGGGLTYAPPTEVDSAPNLYGKVRTTYAVPVEVDSAPAFRAGLRTVYPVPVEIDTAPDFAAAGGPQPYDTPMEVDGAPDFSGAIRSTYPVPTELDYGIIFRGAVRNALSVPVEVDSATALTWRTRAPYTTPAELDSAPEFRGPLNLTLTPDDIAAIADAVYARLTASGSPLNEVWQRLALDAANPVTNGADGSITTGSIQIAASPSGPDIVQARQ